MLFAQYMCCSPSMEVQIKETGNRIPTKSVGQTLRGCSQVLHVYVKIGQRLDDTL